jgi:hypothetical protein
MRSGFRNAESEQVPGGEKSERATRCVNKWGTTTLAAVAPAARMSARDLAAFLVATAPANSVSQSRAGTADIVDLVSANAAEWALPW